MMSLWFQDRSVAVAWAHLIVRILIQKNEISLVLSDNLLKIPVIFLGPLIHKSFPVSLLLILMIRTIQRVVYSTR